MLLGGIGFKYYIPTSKRLGPSDQAVGTNDLVQDTTLESTIVIMIGSNARADDSDSLPSSYNNHGGYWGSSLLGFELGSKLWLLGRAKLTDDTAVVAAQYTDEALLPLVDEGVAASVKSTASLISNSRIDIETIITRPNGYSITFKFYALWEEQIKESEMS